MQDIEKQAKTATVNISSTAAFTNCFDLVGIRNAGTAFEPLLAAVDVADKIKDQNYRRKLKDWNDKYLTRRMYTDKLGRSVEMKFLTERGLYKYLLQSDLPDAEPFQEWVFDRLCEIRRQIIDDAQLEAKIAKDAEEFANLRAVNLTESLDMLTKSSYDDRPLDACPVGMTDFYIAKYVSGGKLLRNDIPEFTYGVLCNIAKIYFRRDQDKFQDSVFKILDQLSEKSAKNL